VAGDCSVVLGGTCGHRRCGDRSWFLLPTDGECDLADAFDLGADDCQRAPSLVVLVAGLGIVAAALRKARLFSPSGSRRLISRSGG